jgi:hypothetical protein
MANVSVVLSFVANKTKERPAWFLNRNRIASCQSEYRPLDKINLSPCVCLGKRGTIAPKLVLSKSC